MNDVLLHKVATIQKCCNRVAELYRPAESFREDINRQDAAVLNIQRACEAAIDMANIVVKEQQLGIPTSARDSFLLLSKQALLPEEVAQAMSNMVGFRNIAVHDYQSIDMNILCDIIENRMTDFELFAKSIISIL